MKEQLVLVHLRVGSGTDTCVSGVHIGCIAAGAPQCHMSFNPHEMPSNAHELCCGYDPKQVRWPHPNVSGGYCPLKAPVASLRQRFGLPPPSGSSSPGRRAVSGNRSNEAVCAACQPWLTILPKLCWAFRQPVITASCAARKSDPWRPWGRVPLCA